MAPASPADLQHHLYLAFLERRTADVALRVRGSWQAVYHLHRVILIQSGFFRSLFTGGFVESSPRLDSRRAPDEIEIVFDDHNITRAAFEVCISRLYGGGPSLYISPALVPTPTHPLTPSFPSRAPKDQLPAGHHPATPRFLLSLLATAIYLSMPSIAAHALNSILTTVGPHTVIRYLDFALGKPVGGPEGGEPEAAAGLEHVAQPVVPTPGAVQTTKAGGDAPDAESLRSALHAMQLAGKEPADAASLSSESEGSSDDDAEHEVPSAHYGSISDKIGEAAACWLARWGPDMLEYEAKQGALGAAPPPTSAEHFLPGRPRARTVPFGSGSSAGATPAGDPAVYDIPTIWGRGGLSAKWVSALVSADTLFVRGERERYDFARAVVELRRRSGIDEEEEEEWMRMFRSGIYYSNMLMADIMTISHDVSPTTNRPYVQLATLQNAHWNQDVLRYLITVKPSGSSASPPPPRDKELGITETTATILSRISALEAQDRADEKDKPYYPVPSDSSLRLGDNGAIKGATMDELFELTAPPAPAKGVPRIATGEATFFGLTLDRHTASSCIQADTTGKLRWSPYPPFRFAVEFWDVEALKEKSRLHSHTIWYAGSLFNVYVQVVRKKGVQLGVYIHRQSSIDPIPASSAPSLLTRGDRLLHHRGPSFPSLPAPPSSPSMHYSPSIHPPSRSTTPTSAAPVPGSPTFAAPPPGAPATAPPATPAQPFRDPRGAIAAYFTVACASATGGALTKFASAPDVFAVSQSWGWKSSSLRTEEYIEVGEGAGAGAGAGATGSRSATAQGAGAGAGVGTGKREVSLRATVVLGLV